MIAIPKSALPTRYLGLPWSINYLKAKDYSTLEDKCKTSTEGWASNTHSFPCRIQLVESVVHFYLICWVQSYKLPLSVVKILEKMMANFICKNRMHACGWESTCGPKSGGFGVRKLEDICSAADLKLFWRCFITGGIWPHGWRMYICTSSSPWNTSAHLMALGTW